MPLHLLVKWEVVSPSSRYREFYHEIGNIEKFPFTYWLSGRWFLQIVDIHVGNFYMKLTGRWFPQIVQWESISNIYIRAMTNSRSFGYESNFNEIRICFQNLNIRSRHATLLQRDT